MRTATCQRCAKVFTPHYGKPGKYCSKRCYNGVGLPASERFWLKVEKGDGCWEWRGGRSNNGYGKFGYPERTHSEYAHRVAWMLGRGPIPPGLQVLHRCDNKGCVRPAHLYLGTASDNTYDAIARGQIVMGEKWRQKVMETIPRGEQHPWSKLTDDQVMTIRHRYATGDITGEHLGSEFDVTNACVYSIVRGESWTHLPSVSMPRPPRPADYLTVPEAARLLGVVRNAILGAIKRGTLYAERARMGNGPRTIWMVPESSLREYAQRPSRTRAPGGASRLAHAGTIPSRNKAGLRIRPRA